MQTIVSILVPSLYFLSLVKRLALHNAAADLSPVSGKIEVIGDSSTLDKAIIQMKCDHLPSLQLSNPYFLTN